MYRFRQNFSKDYQQTGLLLKINGRSKKQQLAREIIKITINLYVAI